MDESLLVQLRTDGIASMQLEVLILLVQPSEETTTEYQQKDVMTETIQTALGEQQIVRQLYQGSHAQVEMLLK